MKYFILLNILVVLSVVGCVSQKDHNAAIDGLKSQIEELQAQDTSAQQSVQMLSIQLNQSQEVIAALQEQLHDLLVSNQGTAAQISELRSLIDDIQSILVVQQAALAQVTTGLRVTSVIDFCGQTSGAFNEVGLRMSDGSTVAFFESGGNRFLSMLLPSTSYRTTDGTNCNFTTNSAGKVCDNLGCR